MTLEQHIFNILLQVFYAVLWPWLPGLATIGASVLAVSFFLSLPNRFFGQAYGRDDD